MRGVSPFVFTGVLVLAGCATERTRDLPVLNAGDVSLVVDGDGPWQEVPDGEGTRPVSESVAVAAAPTDAAAPAPALAPRRPVPERRTAQPPRGVPPTKSAETLARERHLSNPTRIHAQRITFRCPARYAGEIAKSAERSAEESPGRLALSGNARVVCRELTLEADRIVLEVRRDGSDDVQVTAKGDVFFVTVQREQVLREEGAKSLILTNDRVLPLK